MRRAVGGVLLVAAACSLERPAPEPPSGWRELEPGLELGLLEAPPDLAPGPGLIRVLRIDPARFELRLFMASAEDEPQPRSARDWADRHGLVAAMNAGMYQEDYRTSVSLMLTRDHVNNRRLTGHRSVLAFDALDPALEPLRLIDLECESFEDWRERYGSFVQSIRMVSCDGRNVWSPGPERFSVAAIGIDEQRRILMIHARLPWPTHDLIDALLELPLALERLMYAEGGPQAQLFARGADREFEFVGTFDGAIDEHGGNRRAWPMPNALGVARLASGGVAGP